MSTQRFNRGDLVQAWFNDGMGGCFVYGRVLSAGPRVARVIWESRQSNRIPQDSCNVNPARDQTAAKATMAQALDISTTLETV